MKITRLHSHFQTVQILSNPTFRKNFRLADITYSPRERTIQITRVLNFHFEVRKMKIKKMFDL